MAQAGYLFPEIGRRRNAFLADNPDAKIISLGIGDTTLPVPDHILNAKPKDFEDALSVLAAAQKKPRVG